MRTFIILFSLTIFSMSSNSILSQNTNVTISHDGYLKVDEVFKLLSSQTDYRFIYHENLFQDLPKVQVKKGVIKANELLKLSLNEGQFNFDLTPDNTIVITKKPQSVGLAINQQLVKGKVTDAFGLPLFGATVQLKGTTQATSTDLEGDYQISYSNQSQVLIFSMIGFKTKEITVRQQTTLNVTLEESVNELEEVVLISDGYQKVGIEETTGSFSKIEGAAIEKRGYSNLMNALEGMAAGLSITADPSSEGNKKINIRGVSTINGDSSPLIVIDGFITETDISQINPYDLESITLLKDAGATSIYGARASNGVIVITTKKGKQGNTKFNYTTNFTFNQRPDVAYRLNRLTGSELADAHILAANASSSHSYQWYLDNGSAFDHKFYARSTNKVFRATIMQREGYITQQEADAIIDPLRNLDNTNQIEKYFTQSPFEAQHNLSISGGGEKSTFRGSLNYTKNKTSFVGDQTERYIFDLQNSVKFGDHVSLDLSGNFRINQNESIPYDRNIVLNHISAYEMFADDNGNPLPTTVGEITGYTTSNGGTYGGKDPIEIQRLIDLGLYDETYYPLHELNNYTSSINGFNARLQAMINVNIMKGLKGNFGYKYEGGSSKYTKIARKNSFEMKSLINNLAPRDYNGDDASLIIPKGGRIIESRSDSHSYTLRGQLDFEKSIQKHTIRLLAGSEVRHINNTSTTSDQFGYDETTLQTMFVDRRYIMSNTLTNINHPTGSLTRGMYFADEQPYEDVTNRYFSLYGNFSYNYDRKYLISGSARIDQSNLFGTDPKYRYKPFWSLGGKWNIDREGFFNSHFLNKFAIRSSYGINGNIANDYGPFTIAQREFNYFANVDQLSIVSPAVDDLRWERTATFNIGTDLKFLKNRIGLSVDFYDKKTTDVLAFANSNPTYGATNVMKNTAHLRNKGIEVSLNTTNFMSEDFRWSTSFMLRNNSNKVISVLNEDDYIGYIASRIQNVEGQPANSFYLFNWKGLNETGNSVYIDRNGDDIVIPNGSISLNNYFIKEDLVFAGTIDPKFTGSFTNNLSYKNFDLSFMFVFSAGHKLLKDAYGGEWITGQPNNIHADYDKAWKQAGDELTTDISPVGSNDGWKATMNRYSTKNIIDGDFIRLREVTLAYNVPQTLLHTLPIDGVRLNFRANNLLLMTKNTDGIDPEAHGIGRRYFPVTPSYSFGFNVNF